MKTKDLIALLQSCPPNSDVVLAFVNEGHQRQGGSPITIDARIVLLRSARFSIALHMTVLELHPNDAYRILTPETASETASAGSADPEPEQTAPKPAALLPSELGRWVAARLD